MRTDDASVASSPRLQPPRKIGRDRKSTRLNSSHLVISYAVFCLKKKKKNNTLTELSVVVHTPALSGALHKQHNLVRGPGEDGGVVRDSAVPDRAGVSTRPRMEF